MGRKSIGLWVTNEMPRSCSLAGHACCNSARPLECVVSILRASMSQDYCTVVNQIRCRELNAVTDHVQRLHYCVWQEDHPVANLVKQQGHLQVRY